MQAFPKLNLIPLDHVVNIVRSHTRRFALNYWTVGQQGLEQLPFIQKNSSCRIMALQWGLMWRALSEDTQMEWKRPGEDVES